MALWNVVDFALRYENEQYRAFNLDYGILIVGTMKLVLGAGRES